MNKWKTLLAYACPGPKGLPSLGIALAILVALFAWGIILSVPPVQAAPSDVPPCAAINTATLSNGGVISIFRCEPNDGYPYKINSLGFMLQED